MCVRLASSISERIDSMKLTSLLRATRSTRKILFHAMRTRANPNFDKRPFLNLVDKQTITMGCAKALPNQPTMQLWLMLSGPKADGTQ
jgi:hypothetical protein